MKDSQDWLDEELQNFISGYIPHLKGDVNIEYKPYVEAKSAIRKRFLQEALEMIGKDDRDYSGDNTDHDSKIFLVASSTSCNELRQELRNKFNDRYGE